MYKILVISDTHGRKGAMFDLVARITDADRIFHLGDVVADAVDLESVVDIPVDYVAGNCDFYEMSAPQKKIVEIMGNKFYLCHGHHERVKYSLGYLEQLAEDNHYDCILFGHTHRSHLSHVGRKILLNPGSISLPRDGKKPSFAIIQIDDKGRIHATLDHV